MERNLRTTNQKENLNKKNKKKKKEKIKKKTHKTFPINLPKKNIHHNKSETTTRTSLVVGVCWTVSLLAPRIEGKYFFFGQIRLPL